MAGVDDVVGVGVAVHGVGLSMYHLAQLVVVFYGNEMKITSVANIFCSSLQ